MSEFFKPFTSGLTSLVDADASSYFDDSISYPEPFGADHLIEALLKLIYYPVTCGGERVITVIRDKLNNLEEVKTKSLTLDNGSIVIVALPYSNEKPLSSGAEKIDSFDPIQSWNDFFAQGSIPVEVIKNKEKNSAIFVIYGENSLEIETAIAEIMVNILSYIKPISDVKSEYGEVFKNIEKKNYDLLIELCNKRAKEFSIEEMILVKKFDKFQNYTANSRKKMLLDKISKGKDNYEYYAKNASLTYKNLLEDQRQLALFTSKQDGGLLASMFLNNDNIKLLSIVDDELKFGVSSDINMFDVDLYQTIKEQDNSYLNDEDTFRSIPKEDIIMLFDAMAEQKITLTTSAMIILNSSGRVDGYKLESGVVGIPHPHIVQYNCFGGFKVQISESCIKGDYVNAIAIITSAMSNLNWADSTVCCDLIQTLSSSNCKKCFRFGNKILTPKKAIEAIKEGY